MFKRLCLFSLALLFLSFFQLPAQSVPGATQRAQSFPEMQAQFKQWAQERDLSQEKGWKWYKRWEDFQVRRADGHGQPFDPVIYGKEAAKVLALKSNAASKTGNTSWVPIGPFDYATHRVDERVEGIGRINCITFDPSQPNTLYVGVAQGGIWRTVDNGANWEPLNEGLPLLRISDIAIDPNNSSVLYASLGDYAYLGVALETDGRKRNTHYGLGIYKSTNGGQNWSPTGLSFTQTDFDGSLTRRVFVNPVNSSQLVAGGTHGIWTSMDAGVNWSQVNDSLIWDLEQDPSNPNILYASTGFSGYLDEGTAGILKSTNFGVSWTALNTGIPPRNTVQRVELAISRSDPNYIYALTCNMDRGFYGLYRSTNGGTSWSLRSTSPNILAWDQGTGSNGQGTYDLTILVHPQDKNHIYTGGINLWGSADGGATWDGISYWVKRHGPTVHADQHFLAYNPLNQNYYVCNDGGLYRTDSIAIGSWNDALTNLNYNWPTQWTPMSGGMNTTSFYKLGIKEGPSGELIAGSQDNATFYRDQGNWYQMIGGDGMDCFLHPTIPNYVFGSSQYGNLHRSFNGGTTTTWLSGTITEDGEWVTPWMMDPQSLNVLYAGFQNVWKTNSQGDTWFQISSFPNLPGSSSPNLISALAIGPINSDYLYAAHRVQHDLGVPTQVWVTTDAGNSWLDRSAGIPDSLYCTYLTVDDQSGAEAWATFGGFIDGVKVFHTTDAGQTWSNISQNLPNLPVNCIKLHENKPHHPLYVGTDIGVWYTNDTLGAWELYSDDFPNVIVSELEIRYSNEKLVAATFGRGLWEVNLRDSPLAGVQESSLRDLEMKVMPNPGAEGFWLETKGKLPGQAQLELLDVMGRTVFSEPIVLSSTHSRKWFQPQVGAGLYYVRIVAGNTSKSMKWIKSR